MSNFENYEDFLLKPSNIDIEYDILLKFFKKFQNKSFTLIGFKKINNEGTSLPDFECIIKDSNNNKKRIFIEVTTLRPSTDKIGDVNIFIKGIEKELKKNLRKIESNYNFEVLVNLNIDYIKNKNKFIKKNLNIILNTLKEANNIKEKRFFKKFEDKESQDIQWMFLERNNQELDIKLVNYSINFDFLFKEIVKVINEKNIKNYPQRPIWLIIKIMDFLESYEMILKYFSNKFRLKMKNIKFDKIFLQFESYSRLNDNPLFLIYEKKFKKVLCL